MSFFASMASFFPTSTASPHAFSLFGQNQNPRENHAQYAELYSALHPRSRKDKENTKPAPHTVPTPKSRSAAFAPSAHCTYITPPPPYSQREAHSTYDLREALRPSNEGQETDENAVL